MNKKTLELKEFERGQGTGMMSNMSVSLFPQTLISMGSMETWSSFIFWLFLPLLKIIKEISGR